MKNVWIRLIVFFSFFTNYSVEAQSISNDLNCVSIIPSDTAQKFIDNYLRDYYKTFNKKRSVKIEYPKEYFQLLASFLYENNSTYDGVRFVFGSFNRWMSKKDQAHKNQIVVMAAPTQKKIAKWNILGEYNDRKLIITKNTPKVKLYNKKIQTKEPSDLSHDLFIFTDSSNAESYQTNYRDHFGTDTLYSTSLYLCNENFFILNDLINSEMGKDIDGMALLFIHYNKKLSSTKQEGERQISLLIVPSINGEPQMNLLTNFINSSPDFTPEQKETFLEIAALNHGELCPNSCK